MSPPPGLQAYIVIFLFRLNFLFILTFPIGKGTEREDWIWKGKRCLSSSRSEVNLCRYEFSSEINCHVLHIWRSSFRNVILEITVFSNCLCQKHDVIEAVFNYGLMSSFCTFAYFVQGVMLLSLWVLWLTSVSIHKLNIIAFSLLRTCVLVDECVWNRFCQRKFWCLSKLPTKVEEGRLVCFIYQKAFMIGSLPQKRIKYKLYRVLWNWWGKEAPIRKHPRVWLGTCKFN